MIRTFTLFLCGIFLSGQIISQSVAIALTGGPNSNSLTGGLVGVILASPFIFMLVRYLHGNKQKRQVISQNCPKSGEHRWGNPWINSEGPEGGELGRYGQTCLKCGTEKFI